MQYPPQKIISYLRYTPEICFHHIRETGIQNNPLIRIA